MQAFWRFPPTAGQLRTLLEEIQQWFQYEERALLVRVACLLVCAAAGIFLMIPRGQARGYRLQRYVGAFLCTIGLVLLVTAAGAGEATLFVALDDQPDPACWIFHGLAFLSLVSAGMMITARNPVYSALWFALVLLSNSGLYLLQDAEFLSAATIIVYAGAIIVTFLFVIMLAQPKGAAGYDHVSREPVLSIVTGLIVASALVGTIHFSMRHEAPDPKAQRRLPVPELIAAAVQDSAPNSRIAAGAPHVASLGKSLFLEHYVSVEVIGLLLLAAVVGAVLIAGHPTHEPRTAESDHGGAHSGDHAHSHSH
jgi:NADH-quinone oxidoreductase subunit J